MRCKIATSINKVESNISVNEPYIDNNDAVSISFHRNFPFIGLIFCYLYSKLISAKWKNTIL